MLANAGKKVILVEEGPYLAVDSAPNYSLEEMNQKYRSGGLTSTFGKPDVNYVEPLCAGGGSEINAGLCHDPLEEILDKWSHNYEIEDFGKEELSSSFDTIRDIISITRKLDGLDKSSLKIKEGAERLNWGTREISRFWKYPDNSDSSSGGTRQSMSETFIPRAISKGCKLLDRTKVKRLKTSGKSANYALAESKNKDGDIKGLRINFQAVFLCAGAIQTPYLLRNSGIKYNIGSSLCMHPYARVVALFEEEINDGNPSVPVVQVNEFKPNLALGGSNSSLPFLALWMAGRKDFREKLASWKKMGIFYVHTMALGRGKIRKLPIFEEPFVSYSLKNQDMKLLGEGIYKLGELLFAAGAKEIFTPIKGLPSVKCIDDLEFMIKGLPFGITDITTIHLFSSCPMGENLKKCAVNSYGKLHNYNNIYLSDASVLPDPPGVNPQFLIMQIACRNAINFLENESSKPFIAT